MDVSSLGNNLVNQIGLTNPLQSGSSSSNTTQTATSGQDKVAFSDFLQLVQQLKQLQTQDPTAFKNELSDIATKLKNASQQETDPSQASFLSNLSDRFQKAADTGDLSALQPQDSQTAQDSSSTPHHGGHHHHHGGGIPQISSQTADTLASIFQTADSTTQSSSSAS